LSDPFELFRAALSDRYALDREIGRGGMARVFLARDIKHRRPVAIKVLSPELGAAIGAERFLREIEIAAKLTHPHILPLHDSGEAGGLLYYVMPFVEGESLRARLDREKQLPLEDALTIAREAGDALAYAHCREVLHRDVKPENILLESGHAVIADFGIARAMSAAGEKITATGVALGTPSYMSPEQIAGDPCLDGRCDVYSLGCVLYEMLAGEPPFGGPNAQAIFARRMTEPVPSVRSGRENIPESVDRVITKALARAPADRFTTAAHFVGALSDTALAPPSPVRRKRRRLTVPIAVGAVALLAAVLMVARSSFRPALPISTARVAVLPFAVHGSGSLSYLAEGLVDLLSRGLDGAGDLRTIDAASVLTTITREGSEVIDVEEGRRVARRLGAGRYVLGSINASGPRVRIQAALYDEAGANGTAPIRASIEGDTARLFELVDQLSAQLLVRRDGEQPARLTETAAITTRSLVALKAYLDAERRLRAASLQPAKIDSSITMFQRAVSEDSTFALAQYRLAVAAGWANRHAMSTAAATRAHRLSDRLADRDRRLLAAYVDFRRGAANDAERQYRAILQDYPDDLEALFQLADLQYNYNPLQGRPGREAREAFTHVLNVDPGFL
jgi:tRNA A-37 threonylcarbamoyl transferase component Bud32/TolB-like protein